MVRERERLKLFHPQAIATEQWDMSHVKAKRPPLKSASRDLEWHVSAMDEARFSEDSKTPSHQHLANRADTEKSEKTRTFPDPGRTFTVTQHPKVGTPNFACFLYTDPKMKPPIQMPSHLQSAPSCREKVTAKEIYMQAIYTNLYRPPLMNMHHSQGSADPLGGDEGTNRPPKKQN